MSKVKLSYIQSRSDLIEVNAKVKVGTVAIGHITVSNIGAVRLYNFSGFGYPPCSSYTLKEIKAHIHAEVVAFYSEKA